MRNITLIKRLSHVSLFSNNLEKVIKFYCGILKFKVAHKFINKKNDELYGLFLYVGGNTMLEFFKTKKKISQKSKFRHICFQVKNIKSLKIFLDKKGFNTKIQRGNTDKTLNLVIKDFENNEIEFHQYDQKSKIRKYF